MLALKGARLLVNPTGRSDLPRARENLEQCTLVRAQENLVFAASANRVGSSHGPPTWAGGSVIGGPEFPGFPVVLAQAGADEELITAELDFTELASGTTCSRGGSGAPARSSRSPVSSPTSSPRSAKSRP